MIDANISEGFTSAIESKNNIKNSLISLGIIFNENDNFSTYSTKITENLMSKSEVNEGKEKIAVAITNKGVETSSSDSFEVMAENINKIEGGSEDYLENIGTSDVIFHSATKLIPYFYYAPASAASAPYYGKDPITISNISLKNIEEIGIYSFYTNKANFITVNNISCPKLKTVKKYCFYYYIFNDINENSFPLLKTIEQYAFFHAKSINGKVIFPKLTTLGGNFFDSTIKEWNLPNLQFGTTTPSNWLWAPPNCNAFLNNGFLTVIETILLNKLYLLNFYFWANLATASSSVKLKKVVIPHVAEYTNTNFSTISSLNHKSGGANCPNLYYLHLRSSIPDQDLDKSLESSLLLTNYTGLEYLIIGFNEDTTYLVPYNNTIDYNNYKDVRLPNISGCGKVKAVILQLGKTKSADKSFNSLLNNDLNDETKIANLKAGLIDTENEKGYLYLSDVDYDKFMSVTAEAGTNKEWLQGRTRKWSAYQELLVNEYGLDSMAEWYN